MHLHNYNLEKNLHLYKKHPVQRTYLVSALLIFFSAANEKGTHKHRMANSTYLHVLKTLDSHTFYPQNIRTT